MSILQALARHQERLATDGAACPFGYSIEQISFAVVLSPDGVPIDVQDLRDHSAKIARPSRFQVPRPDPSRTGRKIVANTFWDKTAYSLGAKPANGRSGETETSPLEFQAFKDLCLLLTEEYTFDDGLAALRAFVSSWDPSRYSVLPYADEMLGQNIVFWLDRDPDCFVHESPAARTAWNEYLAAQKQEERMCLVSGQTLPMARLHPPIKGLAGAQSSGARIVSFNLGAFASFGKIQGDNAPVSEQSAFAYTSALNTMLRRDSGANVQVGDTTAVFWAEAQGDSQQAAAAESVAAMLLGTVAPTGEEESARVRDSLAAVADGKPLEDIHPKVNERTRFYVLGLAPNASRIAIRFWHEDTIGAFAERIGQHWRDLRLDPPAWTSPPSAWRLLIETAVQRKSANIPPVLAGSLMRAVLTGSRYPRTLLASVIGRMRADKEINGVRVAICKAYLARDHRLGFEEKDVPMSLDTNEQNPAYLLGRLFAIYERVQKVALGNPNTTIKDLYFGAASATPASVFPLLERGSANHLASLRKRGDGGLAHWFDQQVDSVLDGMASAFPRSLTLGEQGRFAIGYHHQRTVPQAAAGNEAASTTETIEE